MYNYTQLHLGEYKLCPTETFICVALYIHATIFHETSTIEYTTTSFPDYISRYYDLTHISQKYTVQETIYDIKTALTSFHGSYILQSPNKIFQGHSVCCCEVLLLYYYNIMTSRFHVSVFVTKAHEQPCIIYMRLCIRELRSCLLKV